MTDERKHKQKIKMLRLLKLNRKFSQIKSFLFPKLLYFIHFDYLGRKMVR